MELEPNQRVVAIWDIHGNLSLLKYCLKAANLIEGDSDDWVGGNTILVQLGDLLDRGAFEVEVLKLLAKARRPGQSSWWSCCCYLGQP